MLGGAWLSTHWLLKESAVWRDRNTAEVRGAQRDADYAYRLAVDAPAAKELRLFGLADWTLERFKRSRTRLHQLQYDATRLRERPLLVSLLLVGGANLLVFWSLAHGAAEGRVSLAAIVVFAQAAIGTSSIAFGGLNWVLDGAAAPVNAVMRLEPAMRVAGALPSGTRSAERAPPREIRFRDVSFAYGDGPRILDHLDLVVPRAPRWRSSDRTAPARPRWPSCCAGCTTRSRARSKRTAWICASWTSRPGAVASRRSSRTTCASSCRFATTSRPAGRPTTAVRQALESAGAADLASLDTILARGYEGGTDLSGGQWQRVALARALCAVQLGAASGAARRADRPARRPRRGRNLRPPAARNAQLHDHPHLTPFFDRQARGSDLRPRTRPRHRARDTRRTDGDWAAATGRCSSCRPSASPPARTRERRMTSSTDAAAPAARPSIRSRRFRRRSRRCGASASWVTATNPG